MDLKLRVYSVLIVSASEKMSRSLTQLLPEGRYSPVCVVKDVGAAKRTVLERSFDIVIINTPLPDDFGARFAADLCQSSSVCVLMLVRSEQYGEICSKVTPYGVLAISKPTSSQILLESVMLLCGMRERLRRMEKRAATVEDKMEEIRIVNRAKWALIEELKMTEADAHRYIEKQAMDRCITRRAVAEEIIRTYK